MSGRVQGVGYRYWTECIAGELELDGWVRNRRDGTVEALFSGAPEQVAEVLQRCQHGPASAEVTSITVVEEDESPRKGFSVLPSA
jgi:acylphosphatase